MEESCQALKHQHQQQSQSPSLSPPVREEIMDTSQRSVVTSDERQGAPLDLSRHSPTQPHTPTSGVMSKYYHVIIVKLAPRSQHRDATMYNRRSTRQQRKKIEWHSENADFCRGPRIKTMSIMYPLHLPGDSTKLDGGLTYLAMAKKLSIISWIDLLIQITSKILPFLSFISLEEFSQIRLKPFA